MTKISAFALAAGLAVTGASLAHADSQLAGKWNYTVGNSAAACTLTLSGAETAGDVAASDGCAGGLSAVAHWRLSGSSLNFISPSGDMVAVLHQKGDGYIGSQIDSGRKVALTHGDGSLTAR